MTMRATAPQPIERSPTSAPAEAAAPSEHDIIRVIALYSGALLDERQVEMLSGLDANDIPRWVAAPGRIEAVHRATLELQNSGALARLEASRHARDMVKIAAEIAKNEENHVSARLAGATFVARAAGTEKPAESEQRVPQHVVIRINLAGNHPAPRQIVIEGDAPAPIEHGDGATD